MQGNVLNSRVNFTGNYNVDKVLEGKLNNIEVLNNLAKVSDVDTIRTTMKNSKFLPRNTFYTTVASKKIGGDVVFGFDAVILSKDATEETISKNISESAQRSRCKMWGNLAQHHTIKKSPKTDSSFKTVFKKLVNIFKK